MKEKSDDFIVNEIPIPPVQGKQFYNGYNLRKKVSTFTAIDKISSFFTIIPSDISFGRTVLVVLPACLEQTVVAGETQLCNPRLATTGHRRVFCSRLNETDKGKSRIVPW